MHAVVVFDFVGRVHGKRSMENKEGTHTVYLKNDQVFDVGTALTDA